MDGKLADIIETNASLLAGTRAVDRDGNLSVLHHATNRTFERFERTSDIGFHFGSAAQARKRVANMVSRGEGSPEDPWRTVTCVLAVRNPLVIADDPGVWNPYWMAGTLCGFLDDTDRKTIRETARDLMGRHGGSPFTEREETLLSSWNVTLRNALVRAGHDGILYRNVFENAGRAIEWSWVAFDDAQVIRIPHVDADSVAPHGVEPGEPLRLRGVRPMRHHQDRGIGYLVRSRDVRDFRAAVEGWAAATGIEWQKAYPLDYRPSFGECRPSDDLEAMVGTGEGYRIRVDSKRGMVLMQPFSTSRTSDELMRQFGSDWSETFFMHGLPNQDGNETASWRSAESLEAFRDRLERVHADFHAAFAGENVPLPVPGA